MLDKQSVIKYLSEGWLGRGTVVLVKDIDLNMFYLTRVIQTKEVKDVFIKAELIDPERTGVIELRHHIITIEDEINFIHKVYKLFTPNQLSEAFHGQALRHVFTICGYGDIVWHEWSHDDTTGKSLHVYIVNLTQDKILRFGVIEFYVSEDTIGLDGITLDESIPIDSYKVHGVVYRDDLDILSISASTGEVEVTGTTYELSSEERELLSNLCN